MVQAAENYLRTKAYEAEQKITAFENNKDYHQKLSRLEDTRMKEHDNWDACISPNFSAEKPRFGKGGFVSNPMNKEGAAIAKAEKALNAHKAGH